jgi:acylphosphatase
MESHQRLHLRIHGRVQGVFYRASTREKAISLGLSGWVRNRSDGTVELVAEGVGDAIRELEAWCQDGPAMAQVTRVEATLEAPIGMEREFEIRPSQ